MERKTKGKEKRWLEEGKEDEGNGWKDGRGEVGRREAALSSS